MSDVVDAIAELRAVSTHEHLRSEEDWVERGPDVLQDLFGHYPEAIAVARRVLRDNQHAVFDVDRVRAAQRAQ